MFRFECDYNNGCVPEILKRLQETNDEQTCGYGEDAYCESARKKIRAAVGAIDADVHFLVGGTQTNLIVIAAALRPHQGALAATTGHINVHETGAVEATGHKVLALMSEDGKLHADAVEAYCRAHYADASFEHAVQPGLCYISQPTEHGLLYTKAELTELREVCDRYGMYLFADGARLGYGLATKENDVSLHDLYALTDVFYIGGTKVGALFGEAVVIRSPALRKDFRYLIKQRGAMFAKGRLLGLQFDTLFTDDLYLRIARHAVGEAMRLKETLRACGIPLFIDSPTNQQFPILADEALPLLRKEFAFSYWERVDETHSAVRLCTSWATKAEEVDALSDMLRRLPH